MRAPILSPSAGITPMDSRYGSHSSPTGRYGVMLSGGGKGGGTPAPCPSGQIRCGGGCCYANSCLNGTCCPKGKCCDAFSCWCCV